MSLHGGTRMDSKQAARAIIFDRRLLIICLWLAVLGLLTWIVAIATEYWYVTLCTDYGVSVEDTGIPGMTQASLLTGHAGLWRTCKTMTTNDTAPPGQANVITACRNHEVFTISELPSDHPINVLIGYWRMSLAFAVMSVLMLLLTMFFSWYTIRVPRYTFKRVSGCLFFITAAVELVVIQVQEASVKFQATLEPSPIVPGHCTWSFSFSFILALLCFIVNIICGIAAISTSGKKKKRVHPGVLCHDHAGEDDDAPILSR